MELIEKIVILNRMKSVAEGLKRRIDGKDLAEKDSDNFYWARALVAQADFHSGEYNSLDTREFSTIATELRLNFNSELARHGFTYERLYNIFGHDSNPSKDELDSAYQIFEKISSNILVQIQNKMPMGRI